MKTNDFSKTPRVGQATSMFVGATSYKNIGSIFTLLRTWFKMVKQMKKMPGYCKHVVYYEPPLTLGTIAFFKDRDSLLKFSRSKYHRDIMIWATESDKVADGGFIRLYNVEETGYSTGKWRSEDNRMKAIENFSPLSSETSGPPVKKNIEKN